jgi:hypothetical protein
VVLIVYLLSLTVLVDLFVLFLVLLLRPRRTLLSCSLSTGYVVTVCLARLFVTVMCGFRVSFGRLCVRLCSVVWLCRPLITHRQMVCLRGFIDLLSRCYVVIALVSRINGVFCYHRQNTLLILLIRTP